MDVLEQALEALGFTAPVKAVYVNLVEYGRASARVLAARLGMTRTSVYDQLKVLIKKGLVVERDIDGKAEFAIHDIADLGRLLEREEKHLNERRVAFEREQNRLAVRTQSVEPKIRFFVGRDAILGSMHDMLWDERLTLQVVWPYEEMIRMLGKETLVEFDRKRIRHDIRIRTIWIGHADQKKNVLWGENEPGVERRYAPKDFTPSIGYTIYGDKVLFISSAKEAFGFTVMSGDFASLLRQQFELLWQVSQLSQKARRK